MPVLKMLPHGLTAGIPPMRNQHQRAKRGEVQGWSEGATRRNVAFLRSIIETELYGHGYALTLSVRDCPPTPDDWHRIRRAWEMRMVRAGMIRLHWVTEWQRRGVPHLHVAIWFDEACPSVAGYARDCWLAVAAAFGVSHRGQHVQPIDGPIGWFRYVSKHAARGVKHYQRAPENIPEGWKQKTGRVWGKSGHWPTREELRINLQGCEGDRGYYAFRRLVRSWRIADARAKGEVDRKIQARRMLECHDRVLSQLRGVSEWITEDLQHAMLANLQTRGFSVVA